MANPLDLLAGSTGLEPAASGVTGRRYNRLNYDPDYWLLKAEPFAPVTLASSVPMLSR